MRRSSLILFVSVLLLPATASARDRAAGDGSLQVAGAQAKVIVVQGSGLIFGHMGQGTLTVVVPYDAADTNAPQISGATAKVVGNTVRYTGTDFRFLFPNGRYTLKFEGTSIDISAVGKGTITAAGLGTPDDGTISAGAGRAQPLGLTVIVSSFGGKKDKDNNGNGNASNSNGNGNSSGNGSNGNGNGNKDSNSNVSTAPGKAASR